MAEEKQAIIIKRIKKGGHGHHGGAWKVAYADFVTAMMAFFMVMWLLGTDEDTKAAITHYFNNPTSAWRKDLTSKETMPLGDRTGAGENILNGAEGKSPDDLVERPVRPNIASDNQGTKVAEILEHMLSDESALSLDEIKFSIPEDQLFKKGSAEQWTAQAEKLLKNVGILSQKYNGTVYIQGIYGHASQSDREDKTGTYEFELSRAVAVGRFLIENDWTHEDRISSAVISDRKIANTESTSTAKKLEFTLSRGR